MLTEFSFSILKLFLYYIITCIISDNKSDVTLTFIYTLEALCTKICALGGGGPSVRPAPSYSFKSPQGMSY